MLCMKSVKRLLLTKTLRHKYNWTQMNTDLQDFLFVVVKT